MDQNRPIISRQGLVLARNGYKSDSPISRQAGMQRLIRGEKFLSGLYRKERFEIRGLRFESGCGKFL